MSSRMVSGYFNILIGRIFKILPLREKNEPALGLYIRGLQRELTGMGDYIPELRNDSVVLSILSILQVYADCPESPVADLRRDVFGAVNLCGRLRDKYGDCEVRK